MALAAAAAILASQLLVPPVVGLANNGDFEKVMGYAGFQYLPGSAADRFYSWIQTRFAIIEPGAYRSRYPTSETLLALAARGLNALRPNHGIFDIRFLGAVHAMLFLAALGLLFSALRPFPVWLALGTAALLILTFTDVGYFAPFNSFYSQTASLLFLLLAVGTGAFGLARGSLSGKLLSA